MTNQVFRFFALASVFLLTPLLADVTHQVTVGGKANIYASGTAVLPTLPGGAGVAPVLINLGAASAGRTMQVGPVTGTVDCCSGAEPNGPDGNANFGGTNIVPILPNGDSYGISGIEHNNRRMFLVGVFLDNNVPVAPPPAPVNFTADFSTLSPLLRQVFYIGDGRNTSGQPQTFRIPDTATRLFLGFADANFFQGRPGYYDDNTGSLSVGLNIEIVNFFPESATDVAVGPQRAYVLAGSQVYVLDRLTLLPLRSPIPVSLPGLRSINAIALWRDQQLLVAGTVDGTSGNTVMFVRAYDPVSVPERLLWTWIGATPATTTSLTGGGSSDCLYVGGQATRYVNGVATQSGLVAKLRWGGILHWEQFVGDTVKGVSAHPAFSSVQVVGELTIPPVPGDQGIRGRGYFQVFAESGGVPGPRNIWAPPPNSPFEFTFAAGVAAAGPGRGVYAVGARDSVQAVYNHNLNHFIRRYSFDGTPLWSKDFSDRFNPDGSKAPVSDQGVTGLAVDSGGIWVCGNLALFVVPGSSSYLRYFGFNQEELMKRYDGFLGGSLYPEVGQPGVGYCSKVGARDGSAYVVGATTQGTNPGFVLKVTRR